MGERYDVAVVGAGPVGSAFALEVAAAGLEVTLIDARETAGGPDTRPLSDTRPLALSDTRPLSFGSRLILERLGVWERVTPATPIERIHVSQSGAFGRAVLTCAEARVPALGYVTDYAALVSALDDAVARARIRVIRGARATAAAADDDSARLEYTSSRASGDCSAALVVVADGASIAGTGAVRARDYGQTAITARVGTTRPHGRTAYERFTPHGPLALLPFADDYALVWTVRPSDAEMLCAASREQFLERLQERFGERAGRFTSVAARTPHALALRVAQPVSAARVVRIGNAAQTLHPVAGQGFNLGLRDAWELAVELREHGVSSVAVTTSYRARRRVDRAASIAFTDALAMLFSIDSWPLAHARGAGLALVDNVPPIKDFLVRRMMFGTRG